MASPNSPPPVQDPDHKPEQPDQTELILAETLVTTRPGVIETELLFIGGTLLISALTDELDH